MTSKEDASCVCLIPLNEDYEIMKDAIYDRTGLPFGEKDFSDFILTLLGGLIPPYKWDISSTLLYLQMYFSNAEANEILSKYSSIISKYLMHMSMPLMPSFGYVHRYYLRSDLVLFVYYEKIKVAGQVDFNIETRESILLAIENGDYIDERTRRRFGIA